MEDNKKTLENNMSKNFDKKFSKINSVSSQIYYFSFVLLNVLTIFLAFLLIKNKSYVEDFDVVHESISFQSIILLVGIFFAIMFLKTIPSFLNIFNKTKKRMLWTAYKCESKTEFLSFATIYSSGGISVFSQYLKSKNIDEKVSIDIAYSRNMFRGLSKLIYCSTIFILGLFLWKINLDIWFLIIPAIVLICWFFRYLIIFLFINHKKFVIKSVTFLSIILYKFRLIKDREIFYNNQINHLLLYTKACKDNKILIFVQIMSCLLEYFLKGVMIYSILATLNMGDIQLWGKVLFGCVVLELIISSFPLQKGALIFEIVFLIIFQTVFFSGYVFWAMVIFRIFDYFVYVLQYLLVSLIDGIFKRKNVKKEM